ncbi:MAG: ester cyclase [Anaerolineae bacterium]|nr:ester cyclase [Anaerolineae bacterium]
MSEQNKAAVRHFIETAFNQHDLGGFPDYYSPNLIDHALPPNMPQGLEGRKMLASMFFTGFPDIRVTIEDMVAEGDKVVAYWSATGTHQGDLMGIPPTGKYVTISGMAIDRLQGGKSVEHWEIIDQLGLMQQLGVIPA